MVLLQAVGWVTIQSQAAAGSPQDLRRTALLRSLLQRTEEKAPTVTPMHSRHKPIGELTAFAVGHRACMQKKSPAACLATVDFVASDR